MRVTLEIIRKFRLIYKGRVVDEDVFQLEKRSCGYFWRCCYRKDYEVPIIDKISEKRYVTLAHIFKFQDGDL